MGRIRVRGFFFGLRSLSVKCGRDRLDTNGRRAVRRPNTFVLQDDRTVSARRGGARASQPRAPRSGDAANRTRANLGTVASRARAARRHFRAPPGSVPSGVPASCGEAERPRGRGNRGGAPNRVSSRVPRRPGARAFVGPRDAARAPRANRTVAGASPRAPGSRETLDRGRAALAGARSRRRVEAKTGARALGGGHERAGGFGAVRLHDVHGTGGAAGGRERDEAGRVAGRPRDGTDARQGVRAEVRAARPTLFPPSPPHASRSRGLGADTPTGTLTNPPPSPEPSVPPQ